MGAILSILIKKTQVVMEIKVENDILLDRIIEIVQEQKNSNISNETQETAQDTQTPLEATIVDTTNENDKD